MAATEATTSIQKSYRLLTTGMLPEWLGVVVFLALGAAVCFLLRREFLRIKRVNSAFWLVVAVRVMIVFTAVWLLCEPLLIVTTSWKELPELLMLVNGRKSMQVREEFGTLHHKIDVLEALEDRELEGRNRAASRLERESSALAEFLDRSHESLQADADDLSTGLPISAGFREALDLLADRLRGAREEITRLQRLLPETLGEEELQARNASLSKQILVFGSSCRELAREAGLVRKEALAHPDLLSRFLGDLQKAREAASSLRQACTDLQTEIDRALLSASDLESCKRRPLTRRQYADLAVAHAEASLGDGARVSRLTYSELEDGLREAITRRMHTALRSVIVIDDGSRGLGEASELLLSALSETAVSIHGVLAGYDGVEPPDVGIIAVDLPRVAVVGRKTVARCLVKAWAEGESRAQLKVSEGAGTVAEVSVQPGARQVVEVPLYLESPGRKQLIFEAQTDGLDAYPGNGRFVTVIDLFGEKPAILILSDALSRDFALFRGVAEGLPYLESQAVLADPRISPIEAGDKLGEFPSSAEQWEAVRLLVLLGSVPEGLPEEALGALKTAVGNGLHVLVLPGGRGRDESGTWWQALGLPPELTTFSGPAALLPDIWLGFHELCRNEAEPMASWARLHPQLAYPVPEVPGQSFLQTDGQAVLQVFLQGKGAVLFSSIPSFSALRQGGNGALVTRLVTGLLELGVRPFREVSGGPVELPAQPVSGRHLWLTGSEVSLSPDSGLKQVEYHGRGARFLVTGQDQISFQTGGEAHHRLVHTLLGPGDFELSAHAEPVRRIAEAGGGRFADLVEFPSLVSGLDLSPASRSKVETYRLWIGWWPIVLMVLLVSAEYLLRRKAGRVM